MSPAGSQLEQYLARSPSDPVVLVTALLVAFFLGAAHALTPGHGKAIVAAYLVGSRGRLIDAVYLGAAVTITHTFSVFILGIVTLYASQQVSLDKIYPWLSLASGVLVMLIGAWLVFARLRGRGASMVHSHGGYSHAHANYGAGHSHSSIVSLGVSGGLVPCPEALVVLMLSVSLRKVGLGLGLLAAFSLGLAAVLIAIGCMMVLAGPLMSRVAGESRFTRSLPVVSACVVTVLGIVMVLQAARTL